MPSPVTRRTIAIVEDEPTLRKALSRLLRLHGYAVQQYASPAEFLHAAGMSNASCVLIDVQLGQASGLDLARTLASNGFTSPIIFMSGSGEDALRQECIAFGCAAYLRKPLGERKLLDAIEDAIAGTSSRT
jgi:FixJ family two-component response regulator